MSKRIKPIKWILTPVWVSCTICKKEPSTRVVVIDKAYHLAMCEKCSQLPETELRAKLFKGKVLK